ncbi:MAG: hypothetical protein C4551_04880 [Bacillota bacterium]|nr:MAG: hypothetical protein C4551_04880 [Bacillota bacterium]
MDLGLVEYALFVTAGLWAALFVPNPLARVAGVVLVVLATLRALTEKDTGHGKDTTAPEDYSGGPYTL